jgi:hypothetical protein
MCREFGWTYQEFLEQPQWFIETYNIMKSQEAKSTSGK